MSSPLTLVAAPAGFGKSTLLADWCSHGGEGRRWAWVSLDEDDDDPIVFWTYVVHALRRIEPERFAREILALEAPGASITRSVLPSLLNELWSLATPIILILDDYHVLTNTECHESLRFLLRRLPPSLRLVVSTRVDPPLGLGALRARGELTELRATDLRFTPSEASTLLNERIGLELRTEELEQLDRSTEGWAAGLSLAALSLRQRDDVSTFVETFAGDNRHVVDYLGGEVLDRLPTDQRAFLLQTSVLESFTADLCNFVTEQSDAAEQLAEVERTNLFLIALDDRRIWYRYHHLFRDLLRVELRRLQPDLEPQLHGRAARWYAQAGDIPAAMRHALAASDANLAGQLFVEHWRPFVAMGRQATVDLWMERMPEAAIVGWPSLAISMAIAAGAAGHPPSELERWLACAEEAGPHPEEVPPFEATSLSAAIAIVRGLIPIANVSAALRAAESAAASETDPGRSAYTFAQGALGNCLYLSGRVDDARVALERALHSPLAPRHPLTILGVLTLLVRIWLAKDELGRADALISEAFRILAANGLSDHRTAEGVHVAHAEVLLSQGHAEQAEAILAERVEPYLETMRAWPFSYVRALLVLASARNARGHVLAAAGLLDEASEVLALCEDPGILPTLVGKARGAVKSPTRQRAKLSQGLSEGELRVLRLLPTDLNQREIGRELYLTMNTIKTHVQGIYTKLNVTSREAAVTKAREFGLIG
jgi:LuxR family maltose regulon positive regulatory protein